MKRSHSSSLSRSAVIIVAGVTYYFVFTQLVGIGAAIAAPSWYVPFMYKHPTLGLTLMSLATHVPMVAISAAIVGYAIARLLPNRHLLYGFLAVCVTVLFSALLEIDRIGFWMQLRISVMPPSLYSVPTVLAVWIFLPLAAHFFGRQKVHDDVRGDAGQA